MNVWVLEYKADFTQGEWRIEQPLTSRRIAEAHWIDNVEADRKKCACGDSEWRVREYVPLGGESQKALAQGGKEQL